jgi:hypothetical protein
VYGLVVRQLPASKYVETEAEGSRTLKPLPDNVWRREQTEKT